MSELKKYRAYEYTGDTLIYDPAAVDARLALMQRAVEWCLRNCAGSYDGKIWDGANNAVIEVPADLAPIICPGSGKGEA